jgi:hypothetical protein
MLEKLLGVPSMTISPSSGFRARDLRESRLAGAVVAHEADH